MPEPSNRELDALAASRIFGIVRDEWWESPEYGWYLVPGTGNGLLCNYTTDPAHCQSLKEKMRADGWYLTVEDGILKDQRMYFARWEKLDDWDPIEAHDPSELRAIVIAAVRAVGVEVPR